MMGAGSWGTTFAKVLTDAGNDVTLWSRRSDLADEAISRSLASARVLMPSCTCFLMRAMLACSFLRC